MFGFEIICTILEVLRTAFDVMDFPKGGVLLNGSKCFARIWFVVGKSSMSVASEF